MAIKADFNELMSDCGKDAKVKDIYQGLKGDQEAQRPIAEISTAPGLRR